jgi:uroporphyrinogen decarboxylase
MLAACLGQPVDRPPVWLMRQAGRYLPEYRAIRERTSFLDSCHDPDLAAEIALQPYQRFAIDAVVIFSDILLPLTGLGLDLDFSPGPVVANPLDDPGRLERLEGSAADAMAPTAEAIRRVHKRLDGEAAVIGFAGAPWTLAAYASEQRLSRDLSVLCGWTWREPAAVERLLDRLADVCAETLRVQIEAGADVLQIFDTWAGLLSVPAFRRFAGAALRAVLERLPDPRPPVIIYARGASHLTDEIAGLGCDVVSIDWRVDLADAARRLGSRVSLQGNLDPAALHAEPEQIRAAVGQMLADGRAARGHIANLGHGVQPGTPIAGVRAFVEAVQESR